MARAPTVTVARATGGVTRPVDPRAAFRAAAQVSNARTVPAPAPRTRVPRGAAPGALASRRSPPTTAGRAGRSARRAGSAPTSALPMAAAAAAVGRPARAERAAWMGFASAIRSPARTAVARAAPACSAAPRPVASTGPPASAAIPTCPTPARRRVTACAARSRPAASTSSAWPESAPATRTAARMVAATTGSAIPPRWSPAVFKASPAWPAIQRSPTAARQRDCAPAARTRDASPGSIAWEGPARAMRPRVRPVAAPTTSATRAKLRRSAAVRAKSARSVLPGRCAAAEPAAVA